ncbi:hypothetical protein AAZX31_04G149000 [Glycine max]|uniref:AIPP2-like SPOC-like domain-containing protein n=1 Tax=Glycine max TaxID=3847 RepID=K7KKJ0_SOYBN|nr:uncharacterized protein LOC100796899 [Glycine max]KAH1111646.1 hypothetical protein GYH30_010141 [Glycine max]KAH1111662.1 hypothetical protein GYH30_010141 [Glycine max]KAH1254560.1 hypothetical protein GmHk_04G010986 [Glycine max]KRH63245.1 hypothetical protein GLYMA_04G163100v4 [Glycine max]KRH63246.1 hypothetical protein GLYMA_04G163100v4 [Glycine max]|eukprot:XP_006578547.1 uncharacterized protein LOC100796899 [Glycine max]
MQPPPKENDKAGVCDICGASGFDETIVTCSKCNINCEHSYCMRFNTLIVPIDWICEPCKSKDVSTSPHEVNQGIGLRASKMRQPVKTGKVKFLPEDEVLRLYSGNFPLATTRKTSVGSKNVVSKIPSQTPKPYPCISPPKVLGKLSRNDEVHKKSMTNQHASCSLSKGPPKECIGENQLPLGGVIPGKKVQTGDAQKENPTKGPFEALSAGKSSHIVGSGPPKECIGENQLPLSGVIPGKKVQTGDAQKENPTKGPFEALSAGKSSHIVGSGPPKECIGENQLPLSGVIPGKKVQTGDAQKENPTKGPFEALSAGKSSHIVGSGPPKECIGENQLPLDGVIPGKKVQTHDAQKENPTKGAPFEALSAGKSSPIVDSGDIRRADAECNKSNIEKSDLRSVQENLNLHCKFLPSSFPAWRGQFQILQTAVSSEFYDGLEAQPPCIVNKKAYKFSTEMPSVLQLESLPVLNALTDIFQDNSPRLQDIALYFFPSELTERSRKNLDSILKFLNAEKSMLRSYINGVELLVFTSNQLDMDSKGAIAAVNAGHFLWGMFRQKKIDKAIERVPDMEPVDMDIDMIGGKDVVERADVVRNCKPKSASLMEDYNKLDVPPGFEEFTKMSK